MTSQNAPQLLVSKKCDLADLKGSDLNALAATDISAEAKKFMVVMNAATSIITTKSLYITRTEPVPGICTGR